MSAAREEPQGEMSRRTPHNRVVRRCANCEIEILWSPVIMHGVTYCCPGCAAGGPCSCDYSQYPSVNIAGVIHYQNEGDVSDEDGPVQEA
ncbi:hypothetical protein [Ktedonobacter robiniae]|uniref:Uncharacterized protein n=1 Tax=Ktedonobacter robiniae TaxID=2778365 RepID=A0ABQ3UNC8_9CHLR|nr:hypothetical protein [Ktedonobacter robiniae]GHO54122.1 hypothetical protein KSB_25970 [Ktedonobacter robiniae]